jgi:alanine racemase
MQIFAGKHMHAIHNINDVIGLPGSRMANPWMEPGLLLTDSRQLRNPSQTLFFCMVSQRNNGHHFIPELYEKGVRNFVVENLPSEEKYPESNFILVKNSSEALQTLAAWHRSQFQFPVIGITGSNGKTIIKEWLAMLLGNRFNIVRSPGSYNSQIGVPLSVWQMRKEHTLGIFEAGISRVSEMEKLAKVIKPDITLISNIGKAHLENFSNTMVLASEKAKLAGDESTLVYCRDYTELHHLFSQREKTFTWSKKGNADLIISKIDRKENFTQIQGIYHNQFSEISIPFSDEASVENAIHCWCVALLLGIEQEDIATGMKDLQPVAMRMQMKEGLNGCLLIQDYYNSDPHALHLALQFMSQQKSHRKRTLILSDVLQSGLQGEMLYAGISKQLDEAGIEKLVGIGNEIFAHQHVFHQKEIYFYKDTQEFLDAFKPEHFWEEVILIKGARPFTFEKIALLLQKKSHETVLEISIPSIIHNVNYFRSLLPKGTKMMGMVKAFSYGTGSYEIASALQFNQMEYLAVAYADEGVELRRKGIHIPIMVMNPGAESLESLIRWKLEPEVYSRRVLGWMIKTARQHLPLDRKLTIHLKINTGMNRLGFQPDEMEGILAEIKESRQLQVGSIFSHLAASEDAAYDVFTNKQIDLLENASVQVKEILGYDVLRHILNTGGIESHPRGIFEMVRLGIGMYGVGFDEASKKNLMHVASLKSVISQIRDILPDETVGYGCKGRLPKGGKIAVIPLGYADGFARRLGNGKGYVMIHGKKAHTVGNICMDMFMADVTEIACTEGDEVMIIGPEITLESIAEMLQTIPYEVLTSLSQRVKRVFIHET